MGKKVPSLSIQYLLGEIILSSELPPKGVSTPDTLVIYRMEMCFHYELGY